MTPLAYLSRLCRRWGGELIIVTEQVFNSQDYLSPGISAAPDGWHAIDIPRRRVLTAFGHADPGNVIHEMGHLFLVEADPANGTEWNWLGWEIVLARRARCYRAWSKASESYVLNGEFMGCDWSYLTRDERGRVEAERIDWAMAIGIVSQDGEPLCTRRA